MNVAEAKRQLLEAYQSGRSDTVRTTALNVKRRANLLFTVAQLGGSEKKMKSANAADHYAQRVLDALDSADKRGWNLATTANLLATIQH